MSAALPPVSAGAMAAAEAESAATRLRFRRALVLTLMTLLVPGSAQLQAGNARLGRFAVRMFLLALAVALILGGLALSRPTTFVSLATQDWFLTTLRFGLIGYAVLWAYLLIDTWRIAEPLGLLRRQRLTLSAVNGVLCLGLSGALLYASHVVQIQNDFISSVFGSGEATAAERGRYNVLLLGADSAKGRNGLRPDSVTVASIDEETGRTVLIGLPRNLAKVPFPADSPMYDEFPSGFDCEGCYLNAVSTWATDHPELFPGSDEPGIAATADAVEEVTGLTLNYYVIIDLQGFVQLVNAVGGIDVKVGERLPIGGPGNITGWIEPGKQHLDGFETLWYARSRATTDDYSRMARQKCVLNAMLHQLDPKTVVTRFGAIAEAGKQVIDTDIPRGEIATFMELAVEAKSLPVSTVSLVPPKINTGDPDWELIQTMVAAAIDRSQAKDDGAGGDDESGKGGHAKQQPNKRHKNANASADLTQSC